MNTIDLDADPFVPEGSTVEEHFKGGPFLWARENIRVIYAYRDWWGRKTTHQFHANLFGRLQSQNPINANLLDYLLANPHLIPEEAKPDRLYFYGTIYRENKTLCVRYIYWEEEKKEWRWRWYGGCRSPWGDELPIPLLVK